MKLGRKAVALGLETLDLALIHEQCVLEQMKTVGAPAARTRMIQRARKFFAESIVAMEETHRSALEANAHLSRLNRGLNRRTTDLATSNRQLKKEIARRRTVEETLRKSEQHSRGCWIIRGICRSSCGICPAGSCSRRRRSASGSAANCTT
jgi:C4-dicarboxylate-specific signal transduction histidine kinase